MKKTTYYALAGVLLLALTGCTASESTTSTTTDVIENDDLYGVRSIAQELPDGRSVICVTYARSASSSAGAGITCDWENAQ